MRAIYIADDGTEFNDRDECEFYENMQQYNDNCPIMSNGEQIFTFKDICGSDASDAIASFDDVDFIVFRNAEEYRAMCFMNDEYLGYTVPDFCPDRVNYPIRFYWDKERKYGAWVNLDEELDYLQSKKEYLDKIEKGA
ncbi:MAG: hypothetical protein IJ150_05860 [Bacteroidales bacterium]|nr:hypothetical protein [Bacteroidales bacterium]